MCPEGSLIGGRCPLSCPITVDEIAAIRIQMQTFRQLSEKSLLVRLFSVHSANEYNFKCFLFKEIVLFYSFFDQEA